MKKTVITFGLISGTLVTGLLFLSTYLWENKAFDFENAEIIGYGSMIISFSMIFFGIKSYRDNYSPTYLTFGKAFKIGLLITIISSVMYVTGWEIYYHAGDLENTFVEKYTENYLDNMEKEGATQTEIADKALEMQNFGEMYKNPFFRIAMTFVEILPVGLLTSLICAAILRRKDSRVLEETNVIS